MNLKRAKQIKAAWDRIERTEPDISTERLLEMVSQEMRCDNATVCEAMVMVGEFKPVKP